MNGFNKMGSDTENELIGELAAQFEQADAAPAEVVSAAELVGLAIKCAEALESGGLDPAPADELLGLLETEFLPSV